MAKPVRRALMTGSAFVATFVADRLADQIWKMTGYDDVDPADPDAPLKQAVLYAALTGLLVAGARTFAARKAAQVYAYSTTRPRRAIESEAAAA